LESGCLEVSERETVRAASTALINMLNAVWATPDAQVLMADCYTLTLRTGLILTYTDADVPIALNGYSYLANSVLVDGLKFKCAVGLDVDQQQITISAKATDTINGVPFLEAIRNGVFDGCEIQREKAFLTSWTATPVGSVILFKGRVGTIDAIGRTTAQITVNSDLVLLDLNMPRNLYSPQCVHVLYDSGCGLVKSAFGSNGTAGAGSSASQINWASSTSLFTQGTVLFSSGVNAGVSANIKSASSSALVLSAALPNVPAAGDTFTAFQGCDHTMATCQSQFNNLVNFRGFPFVPPPTAAY
jgi:uncharacterized phage protein (TIGR02218 family)